jgi:hypothetical protein
MSPEQVFPRGEMTTYSLHYSNEDAGSDPVIFEADDAAAALLTAHQLAHACSAELWRNGQKLCSIDRSQEHRFSWPG